MFNAMRVAAFGLVLVLVLVCALPAHAQLGASVRGSVLDQNGATVAGAKVTVTNQDTGQIFSAVSSPEGFYQVSQLPPGKYSVAVEATGFKKFTASDVTVDAEQVRGYEVHLEIGSVEQSVTVTATNPGLMTEDAAISGTLTAPEIERLPEFNRDPYELLRLSPGIFGDGERGGDGRSVGFPNGPGSNGGTAGPGGSIVAIFQTENQPSISANGQRITSNDYTVDGVNVNSLQFGGAATLTPSTDSIQEITVLSNSYDATDGRSSGAHVKVVTKSGTNQFHGGGFFQYEEPGLNAFNKFGGFNAGTLTNTPPVRDQDAFRQFGGNLGGPILKDKLFFFFNYEGLRDNKTTFENQWVETSQFDTLLASQRAGTPVAVTLMSPGLAPRIGKVLPTDCSLWIQAGQPCQVVTGGIDIGSPGLSYGQYIPSFTSGSPLQFAGGGLDGVPDLQFAQINLPAQTSGEQYNARVDYVAGRNTFSANTFLTSLHEIAADAGAQGRPMADFKTDPFSPSGFLSWVSVISPTTVNEARFNFTRFAFNGVAANPQINFGIPRTEIQGLPISGQRIIIGAAQGSTSPGIFAENTFAFRDIASEVFTRHALRYGFEFNREQNNNDLLGGARPDFVFQGPWNFANGTPIFEAITVNPVTGGPTSVSRYYRTSDVGLFIQDDWKVRPNLTINLGLRWEYYSPPTEARGNLENIIPGPGINGLATARAVLPGRQYNPTWRNFGPRLGFAWSPDRFHNNAVVRGGFGIAFDRFDDISFDNTNNNVPLVANYGICCGTAVGEFGSPFKNGQILYATGANQSPLGYPVNPALATPLDPATNLPIILSGQGAPDVYANPVNSPIPYIYLYSLQVQYSLPKSWIVTVGYQGSSSHKLLRIKNLRYFYPNQNPFINNIFSFTPDTNANFNALLTQIQHRFKAGFLLDVSYTYSKSIDQVSAEGPGFGTNQTFPTNSATERGPSDYDVRNYFRVFGLWDLPIARTRTDWVGKIFGGWQINGLFEFHSGFPWTPVASDNCFTLGSSFLCPIRPTGYLGGAGTNASTSAFLPPTAGNFPKGATSYFNLCQPAGTPDICPSATFPAFPGVGRNSFRGPRYSDVDLSLAKHFGLPTLPFLGEHAAIELRANMFNAFNKLNLAPFTFGSTSTTVSFFNNNNVPVANPQFGTATAGLAGRVVELQGSIRF